MQVKTVQSNKSITLILIVAVVLWIAALGISMTPPSPRYTGSNTYTPNNILIHPIVFKAIDGNTYRLDTARWIEQSL